MTGPVRWIIVLAIAGGFFGASPAPAEAGCTEDYMSCLNTAGQLAPLFREMKDIECMAGYSACIASKFDF